MRRTPGRRSPRLARSTTGTGFLGARFWGQVRGSSGRLRILQGKGGTRGETTQIAGKARYQAPFPGHIAAGRILHGKEGVDGSSPSEGFRERPGNGRFRSERPHLSGGAFSFLERFGTVSPASGACVTTPGLRRIVLPVLANNRAPLPGQIRYERLSPASREVLGQIALRLTAGWTSEEIDSAARLSRRTPDRRADLQGSRGQARVQRGACSSRRTCRPS